MAEASKAGQAALAQGRWAEARAAYREALGGDAFALPALKGAAQASMAEAALRGRAGRLAEAQQVLGEAVAWLTERYSVYERARDVDPETLRKLNGFARMYRAEAHSERMRWLTVAGQAPAAAAEQKAATEDFELAWQFLQRDSTNYWEFLVRRAEHRFLRGDLTGALEDLAITTQTNNTSVPAPMWLAHTRGARRVLELALAKGDAAAAAGWAAKGVDIAKSGEAWKSAEFTQEQWLEGARVVALAAGLQTALDKLTPLRGLLGYYVKEAAKAAPPPWADADAARSQVLAAEALVAGVEARYARLSKNEAEAARQAAAAEAKAREAVSLAEKAAQGGGPLPAAFPYRALAEALRAGGKAADATAAEKAAWAAAAKHPD